MTTFLHITLFKTRLTAKHEVSVAFQARRSTSPETFHSTAPLDVASDRTSNEIMRLRELSKRGASLKRLSSKFIIIWNINPKAISCVEAVFLNLFPSWPRQILINIAWPSTLLAQGLCYVLYVSANKHYYCQVAISFLHVIQWLSCCWTQSMCSHAVEIRCPDNCVLTYVCPSPRPTYVCPSPWHTFVLLRDIRLSFSVAHGLRNPVLSIRRGLFK